MTDSKASPRLYRRHQRYARPDRLRRSDQASAFLKAQGARLTGADDPGHNCIVKLGTSGKQFTATAHPFTNGEGPVSFSTAPSDLATATAYWVKVIDANTIALAKGETSLMFPIATTDVSGGTFVLKRPVTKVGIFELLENNTAEAIKASTNIDKLN